MIRTDLGRRIELVAMDPHFHDISVALHRAAEERRPAFDINSYSAHAGAQARLQAIAAAMVDAASMETVAGHPLRLRFACGAAHERATRRAFIEACKLDPSQAAAARPLEVYDKKTDTLIRVAPTGNGGYRAEADATDEKVMRRVATVAGGLVKLANMEPVAGTLDQVRFSCGHDHHGLVAMLLLLALNARGVLREQELAAARGVLSSPSQQR